MHILEGVIQSGVVLGTGAALTAAGTAYGIRSITDETMPRTGLMAGVFFVASLIHVPVGPSSAHLLMNGLAGLILGPAAFPALLAGLFLQALLFHFGGLTTLGVNTFDMAAPAVLVGFIFRPLLKKGTLRPALCGFGAGVLAILLSAIFTAGALVWGGEEFFSVAAVLLVAHIPIALIEGIIAAFTAEYLARVKPEIIGIPPRAGSGEPLPPASNSADHSPENPMEASSESTPAVSGDAQVTTSSTD